MLLLLPPSGGPDATDSTRSAATSRRSTPQPRRVLSHYLHTPALARVGPDGCARATTPSRRVGARGRHARRGRTSASARDAGRRIRRVSLRVVDSSGSVRGVSERVFVRHAPSWKVAVTTASPPRRRAAPVALVGATLVDGTGAASFSAERRGRDPRRADRLRGTTPRCPFRRRRYGARRRQVDHSRADRHARPILETGWVDGRPDALDLAGTAIPTSRRGGAQLDPTILPLLPVQRRHVGLRRRRLPVERWTCRRGPRGPPRRPRVMAAGSLPLDHRPLADLPRSAPVSLHGDEATVRKAVRAHKVWGAAAIKVWYIMPPQPPDTARVSALVRAAGDELGSRPTADRARHGLWERKDALRAGARVLVHSVCPLPG